MTEINKSLDESIIELKDKAHEEWVKEKGFEDEDEYYDYLDELSDEEYDIVSIKLMKEFNDWFNKWYDNYSRDQNKKRYQEFIDKYGDDEDEEIPDFYEWVESQGLDIDTMEENPDVEEYYRKEYKRKFGESLTEGARSGVHQVSLKLALLKDLKKNPNYKEDPRWADFANVYDDVDEAIYETEDYLRELRLERKWESLNEDYDYETLEDYVRHYMGDDEISLEEIWEDVFNNEHDEDLANDVVAEIEAYRQNPYDAEHAEEWMERYPHGYYNNEDDYEVDESLTEAAPRKTIRVELYYNGELNDTVYFPTLKDAYKFSDQKILEDEEVGLDKISIFYNYTEGFGNMWVNDGRGWLYDRSKYESLNEAVAVDQWFIVRTPNGRMKDGKTTKYYISVQRNGAGVEYDETSIPNEVTTWGAYNQRIVRVDKSYIMGIFNNKDQAIQVAKSIIEANDNFFSDLNESLNEDFSSLKELPYSDKFKAFIADKEFWEAI